MAGLAVPTIQINLHHSKGASAILARSMAVMQKAIAIIQEPWVLNNAIKGLSGCGTIYKTDTQDKIRTRIAIKGLNAIFMSQLSDGDTTVIRTRLEYDEDRHLDLLIGSVYMPYDSQEEPPPKRVRELVFYAKERGLELLLGCDVNSHHIGWGSSNINPRGESLHKFIMDTGLMILNRGTVLTFMDCRRQEVLDITISTGGVADLVRDWRVSGEPSGSDHRQIRYNLRHMVNKEWGRNPRTTNWEGYRMEAIL
ncbi:PREDICTED: uncharacterized protein LOC108779950 [Cyphomyrmex costatus]|uniref:uncharacterized protein LOC108779950 n=1 Tax=Cyphomyrmex costatus TaxID=456900 RepID=UPI0008523BBF|nr:PREDICTED: uncharacterized protein LOC108779950 [Cyphomyrmex costatus]